MTDDPGSGFTTVWNAVVSELNGDPKVDDGPSSDANLSAPLTPQQRAWLNLVQPLTIVEGLLCYPCRAALSKTKSSAICGPRLPTLSAADSDIRSNSGSASLRRRPTKPTTLPCRLPKILLPHRQTPQPTTTRLMTALRHGAITSTVGQVTSPSARTIPIPLPLA